jgi:hypothetical protein
MLLLLLLLLLLEWRCSNGLIDSATNGVLYCVLFVLVIGYYDEVEIEDMTYDEAAKIYYYPCPCGDRFQITRVCHETLQRVAS